MNAYSDFAKVYDRLMRSDIDYEKYADYIENLFGVYDISPDLVCDLACGTGNITIPLAKRGYNMTGADCSFEMLNIAREKSAGLDILYLEQSVQRLDLYGSMGAILCMIDGFNYIISPKSLEKAFWKIKNCFLDTDGVLIFDISSKYKLETIIGNNTFIHSDKDIFYSWRNRYIKNRSLSDMMLDFFVKGSHGYERFEERHLQRAWSEEEITVMLKRAGFNLVDVYGYMSFSRPEPTADRIVFAAR